MIILKTTEYGQNSGQFSMRKDAVMLNFIQYLFTWLWMYIHRVNSSIYIERETLMEFLHSFFVFFGGCSGYFSVAEEPLRKLMKCLGFHKGFLDVWLHTLFQGLLRIANAYPRIADIFVTHSTLSQI